MRRRILLILFLCFFSLELNAQFREAGGAIVGGPPGTGKQGSSVNPESDVQADSVSSGFSFKTLYRGLTHKEPLKPGYRLMSSALLPGSIQIYNKDYWKLPIVYGGIGAGIYQGITFNKKYHDTGDAKYAQYRNYCYIGAAAIYWASMLDGVASGDSERRPDPDKSTLYSALLPGLGQAYNGDWWHIPIWYSGFAVCAYTYHINDIQYKRFKAIYKQAVDPTSGYIGNISSETALWLRDLYRRYRDYSIVATIEVYALNIIDANIFAYMSDFNVSDDLSLNVQPTIIEPLTTHHNYASSVQPSAFGLQMSLKF